MARGRGYVQNAAQRLAVARSRLRGTATTGGRGRGRGRLGGNPSAMPWDSQAQRESGELGNEGADARASLAAQYAKAQSDLGFGSGAANPYSASAENKTQLTNDQRGITNASGNQLYAGSTANAQSQARGAYDKTQKGLEDSFAAVQSSYTGGLAKTGRDESLEQNAIREGALNRAAASEPPSLGVGGRGRGSGRGRIGGPGVDGRNVRRPGQARAMNARARAINARVNTQNRGRGRL